MLTHNICFYQDNENPFSISGIAKYMLSLFFCSFFKIYPKKSQIMNKKPVIFYVNGDVFLLLTFMKERQQ